MESVCQLFIVSNNFLIWDDTGFVIHIAKSFDATPFLQRKLSKTALILAFDANFASLPNLRSFKDLRALWVVPRVYSWLSDF